MMAAKRQTAQDKAGTAGQADISALADELRETERKAEEIRERAKGMLPGTRQTAEDAVSDYNRLMDLSGSDGPLLAITEKDGDGVLETASEAPGDDDTDTRKGRRGKAVSGPGRAQNGHDAHDRSDKPAVKTGKGAGTAPPLDPNSVDFADKDGVVVDDYKTTDAPAEDGDDDAKTAADGKREGPDADGPDTDADAAADEEADEEADDADDDDDDDADDDGDADPDGGDGSGFDFLSDGD